jgi:dimeric dUTPase (all-alpha-NTP-PPase superfamily)
MNDQKIISIFNECLTLQDKFNAQVNPDWRNAGYNWRRAMWIEAGELMDHVGYKWWKNIDAPWDQKQVLLEVVDIFHFLLSDSMIRRKNANDLVSAYKWATHHTHAPTKEKKLKQIEEFVFMCLDGDTVMTSFFQVMISLNIDADTLAKYYLGKNALNKFRQDNGYKSGAYKKEWMFMGELVEDNKVLEHILESSTVTTFDTIYNELKALYA